MPLYELTITRTDPATNTTQETHLVTDDPVRFDATLTASLITPPTAPTPPPPPTPIDYLTPLRKALQPVHLPRKPGRPRITFKVPAAIYVGLYNLVKAVDPEYAATTLDDPYVTEDDDPALLELPEPGPDLFPPRNTPR